MSSNTPRDRITSRKDVEWGVGTGSGHNKLYQMKSDLTGAAFLHRAGKTARLIIILSNSCAFYLCSISDSEVYREVAKKTNCTHGEKK